MPFWSPFLQTRTVDPASGLTIDWLPIQDFMYFTPPPGFEVPVGGNYQGKAYVLPITDPIQFVRDFWMVDSLSHLRDATVVGIVELPAVADDFLARFGGPGDAGVEDPPRTTQGIAGSRTSPSLCSGRAAIRCRGT